MIVHEVFFVALCSIALLLGFWSGTW